METYDIGTKVKWKWGSGWGRGQIAEHFEEAVSRSISGAEVKRNASPDNPAYLIEQDDGGRVLKSHSELEKDSQS